MIAEAIEWNDHSQDATFTSSSC
uniref:Uncharacterized protein n=1 Tax=Arundo donax TaxID=35708 RepID=A0A0A9BVA4_ARUDO